MASKFISPGVFTQEIDQSFLEQGVAGIGAAVIGASKFGPAFVPTRLANYQEFFERFGGTDPKMQAPYAAKNYLKNAGTMNFVRVLGHGDGGVATAGYSVGGITGIVDSSGSNGQVLAVIHHSGTSDVINLTAVTGDANKFIVQVTAGATVTFAATASFLTSSDEYIEKVLNTDPTRYGTDGHYLYQVMKYATLPASASWHAVEISGALTSFASNFTSGSTPWIRSQLLGGTEYNMFKFHGLGHGRAENDRVKVMVRNIKSSVNPNANPYGSFDVVVRDFYDTDLRPVILETFSNVNINPNDVNYIGRRIGTQYDEFDTNERKFVTFGDFPQKSKSIRVEMIANPGYPSTAIPWGHLGYDKMSFATGSDTNGQDSTVTNAIPDLNYQGNMKDGNGNWNANIAWGVQFVSGGVVDRMRAFPNLDVAANALLKTADTAFSLKHLSGTYESGKLRYEYNTTTSTHAPVMLSASIYQFSLPLQGGFDGLDLTTENDLDVANATADTDIAVASMKRALDTVADPDQIDINLLVVPGVHNLKVTDHARTVVNDRQDAMYIMDITGSTVATAISNLQARQLDDNYTACYYPDVKIDDPDSNRIVRVSPSTVVVGAYSYNDRVGQQWFAPAGLNRGGLDQFNVKGVSDKLTFKDRNDLYDNRINPVASFPNEGVVVYGQKTLQVAASALDRVNVRRLLIFAKKTIASAAKFLLFEPNNPATYQRFINTVNPILDRVREGQGIERFQVVMDTNLNTPDVVDRNVMIGKIFLQPTKTAEFIDLQFVISSAGVEFNS